MLNNPIIVCYNKHVRIPVVSSYIWILLVSGILYTVLPNILLLLVFATVCFALITIFWIGNGRKIVLDRNGVEISFLWIRRKYLWSQMLTTQLFESNHYFGYRAPYKKGVILSHKKVLRPSWLHPMQYCMFCHPFSCVVLNFPHTKEVPKHYLPEYEVDRECLMQLLDECGVRLKET